MKVHLPNSAFLGNIDSFIRAFDPNDETQLDITSNPNWVSIHPMCSCIVGSLGLTVEDKSRIRVAPLIAKSRHYFKRIGLFKLIGIPSGFTVTEHDASGRFIPLSLIKKSDELPEFITEMVPLLHIEPEYAEPIRYVMSELIRNVLEHANSPFGALVCAQYYKDSHTIRLGVVDRGLGIKRTITVSHPASDDIAAIRLALTPGITGTTTRKMGGTELNAGAGLFFIKSIAKVNKDFFVIYSGNAMYKLLRDEKAKLNPDPFDDKHSKIANLPYWQGTAVGIDMSLKRHKKFEDLLDLIRDVYHKDVKDKRRFKKPKFI